MLNIEVWPACTGGREVENVIGLFQLRRKSSHDCGLLEVQSDQVKFIKVGVVEIAFQRIDDISLKLYAVYIS